MSNAHISRGNPFSDNLEFMLACGKPFSSELALDLPTEPMQWGLIVEELAETRNARVEGDAVEAADGLCDIIKVASEYGETIGCAMQACWSDPGVAHHLHTDASNPFDLIPARDADERRLWTAIEVAFSLLQDSRSSGRVEVMPRRLKTLIHAVTDYGVSLGFPMQQLWDEVHRSNMDKVDKNTGKVTRREDGKILKPEGWKKPDIAGVLAKHAPELNYIGRGRSLDEFIQEVQAGLKAFEQRYRADHLKDPENFPLVLPISNAGLWEEFFIDWLARGHADNEQDDDGQHEATRGAARH